MACTNAPEPRIALDAQGGAVVAWNTRRFRVAVALARRTGGFGRHVDLGRGSEPAVALRNGRATVVWQLGRRLLFSRSGADGRFSAPRQLARPISTFGDVGDGYAHLSTQPDGSAIVVYSSAFRNSAGQYRWRLRAVTLSAAGAVGPVRELGPQYQGSFATGPGGRIVICCANRPVPVGSPSNAVGRAAQVFTPGAGWQLLYLPLTLGLVEGVAVGDGPVAFATLGVKRSGDAGALGIPGVTVAQATDVFGPPLAAELTGPPTRGLSPGVAIARSGRVVLVYQEKSASHPFERDAPVWATTTDSPAGPLAKPVRLDAGEAYDPSVRAYRDGAIVAWATGQHRWGVAVEHGGAFSPAAAPPGRPSPIGGVPSRDLAVAGRYAGLTWTEPDGSIRASVGSP